MIDTANIETAERELDSRSNDGVEVTLLWQTGTDELVVEVVDTKLGDAFRLAVDAADALDAFHHPYAYAASRGVEYEAANLERAVA